MLFASQRGGSVRPVPPPPPPTGRSRRRGDGRDRSHHESRDDRDRSRRTPQQRDRREWSPPRDHDLEVPRCIRAVPLVAAVDDRAPVVAVEPVAVSTPVPADVVMSVKRDGTRLAQVFYTFLHIEFV